MKKTLLLFFICWGFTKPALAQDFPYDQITKGEMDMYSYANDPSAHAVVLQEHGNSSIDVVNNGEYAVIYEYHVKIKIFDNKGFDQGSVRIPVFNNSQTDSYETVFGIAGLTYYKDEKGVTQKIELENKNIYPEKENKYKAVYKFALPGLRNGCVIEYKYKIESPYFENFRSWSFQSNIPKINSEYEVHIPGFWDYNASLRGRLKLTKNISDIERSCFTARGGSCDCSHFIYGISNVPAFVTEDYMTAPKNFLAAINFELIDYVSPYDGTKIKFSKDWKDIDYSLKTDTYFGWQLKRKSLVKDRVTAITAGKTNDLDRAKAIYAFWQKNFKLDGYIGIYSFDGIGKALETHSGSVADINLSLITALSAAGLNAEAVLLSTRDNGKVNPLYPALGDFNYVVAKVNIGDKSYLLDATAPLLPFGMLPFICLNDKGRVFNLDKPSYWMDLNLPQIEKKTYSMDLTLNDDGKLKGTITNFSIGYEAYIKRLAIKNFNSIDEYVESVAARLPRFKILKSEIDNPDSLDLPIIEKYEVEINLYDNKTPKNSFSFNPFFMDRITNNPFKLAERSYPVDRGMPYENRFMLTMHLPADYSVDTPPQAISVTMPDNGGKFLTGYDAEGNSFTFSSAIVLNKSIYSPGEYPYLKELYNRIIQSEKAEIVFKKK
jgi:hypothetical protein